METYSDMQRVHVTSFSCHHPLTGHIEHAVWDFAYCDGNKTEHSSTCWEFAFHTITMIQLHSVYVEVEIVTFIQPYGCALKVYKLIIQQRWE